MPRPAAGWQARATEAPVLGSGLACLLFVGLAVAAAFPEASPLAPEHVGGETKWAWLYLGASVAAFVAYVLAVVLLGRDRRARVGAVLAITAAVQLVPLAGPVLLSTDAYTYWDYGRLGAVHDANPYSDPPSRFPDDSAYALMGERWRDTTTVYGPGFTLLSEGHASVVGDSAGLAGGLYKGLAAAAMLALAGLAARLGRRPAFSAAFVGWNPLLALHFAGGGHNDALMMAFVLAALALAASGRRQLEGAAWACSIAVKWVPLLFLPLRAIELRRNGRPLPHAGFAFAAVILATAAFLRYGTAWLGAFGPLADNLSDQARYSIPNRLSQLGLPEGVAAGLLAGLLGIAYLALVFEAWRGRARLGLCAGFVLLATTWLVPWYAVWAVPLAAVEEDGAARWLAIGLSAYLLRDAVPI